ncbi:PREDICTED: cinnamoyl-CoA reductase 2-like [Camelina sativa]|uniref:Cinnamoyl-CoA reductase 2-like n=1 Tax=Camelina sativa TaxID=90675 RepID=A0ABM0TMX9_CAMSA|nr:PREDICTED: cinnamoyl-CoA reductase 2-like [Camelina sativa]
MAEKQKVVCVTGAGGFIASWLVKFLLSGGYTVHGTVRDPCDEKNDHLKKLDKAAKNLKLFKADLFDYEGLSSAIAGCSGVFHIASPVPFEGVPITEEEVIKPALTGTKNVLEACTEAKVKKVVVVSSIAAVVYNPKWPQDAAKDEGCWSDTQYVYSLEGYWPYYYLAKTLTEREALEWSKRNLADVVTLCPSVTIGPRLQSRLNSSSLGLLRFIKGGIKSLLSDELYLVDVRDVADALLLVYENPKAKGRYICNSHSLYTDSLMEKLKNMYPKRNFPESFTESTEKEVKEVRLLSSEKLQNLGWKFRPLEETIDDSVVSFEAFGDLPKPY